MIARLHMKAKAWWYERGHRPEVGSLMYSPSLALVYAGRDMAGWVRESMDKAVAEAEQIANTVRENKATRDLDEAFERGVYEERQNAKAIASFLMWGGKMPPATPPNPYRHDPPHPL